MAAHDLSLYVRQNVKTCDRLSIFHQGPQVLVLASNIVPSYFIYHISKRDISDPSFVHDIDMKHLN